MPPKDQRKSIPRNNDVHTHRASPSGNQSIISNNSYQNSTQMFPDFVRSNSHNDINTLSSDNNSFVSLSHVQSTNSNNNLHQNVMSLGNSVESLHSLPNMNALSPPSNKNLKTNTHSRSHSYTNVKDNLLAKFKDKNKKPKKRIYAVKSPVDNSTIMEDDESDHALNVPMLPAFNKGIEHATYDGIPKPHQLTESDPFNPDITKPINITERKQESNPFESKIQVKDPLSIDSDKFIKTTIDQDFDVNFSKDSHMSRGERIFQIRKQKGINQNKKPILEVSSGDDDTSTEDDSSSAENPDNQVRQFNKNDDDLSIKSGDSKLSIKRSFRNFFRRRAFSTGGESVKSVKSTESNKDDQENLSEINETNETNKLKNSGISTGIGTPSSHIQKTQNNEFDTNNSFKDSDNSRDVINEKSSNDNDEKSSNDNDEKSSNDNDEKFSNDNDGNDSLNEKELRSVTSSNKGEHFLKNIFHLEGLLGQGGMTPSVNLKYNAKHKPGFDEENPEPESPNFQDEIKGEAEVLVDHMFKNPVMEMRKKRLSRTIGNKHIETVQEHPDNGSVTANNTTDNSSSINNYFYVPEGGHLQIDPFDDLQDIHNLSIDIPDNIKDKPRKYKAGIQSALLQLYNTHLLPSVSTATSLTGGSSSVEATLMDSNPEVNDLNMDISDEIIKNGLGNLHPHDASNVMDADLPKLETKVEEITEDAQVPLDDFTKIHKKAASIQNIIFGKEKLKLSNHIHNLNHHQKSLYNVEGSSNGDISQPKKKSDVTFQLPNFTSKPYSSASFTPYEKEELQGYKTFKRRARFNKKLTKETTARITVHIADVLERQRFILTLCKAFMLYGAPTHRLEEYMSMTAQVLEIDGSFIYFPGCMLVSFGDLNARTSEMKLVRCAQGLNLGKLDEVHDVYKNVVHDRLGTVEGYELLDEIMSRKPKFNAWWCIFFYSVASLAVAPWSFGGSWIDLPICFGIGAIIAFLQFVICPKNTLYSSVFEVSSSIIASFIARAIGSINNGNTFCYAAIVQSPLALILPGYIILCGSLELQSRNIVAGSVRMFYAFIYSLMLSFGMTLGAALYGWLDKNATSATSCNSNISPWYYFLFIPLFTMGIALTNQASWSQLPMMSFISGAGYVVSYFSSHHFKEVTELNATLGCFIIGLVSNIYSRLLKSLNKYFTTRGSFMTVSLMLPGIFVQVPSGIASQGSVFTGINTANSIVNSSKTSTDSQSSSNQNALSFGMVMIQVALGISVGLYLSTIIVYPFGKKNTGLFTL